MKNMNKANLVLRFTVSPLPIELRQSFWVLLRDRNCITNLNSVYGTTPSLLVPYYNFTNHRYATSVTCFVAPYVFLDAFIIEKVVLSVCSVESQVG